MPLVHSIRLLGGPLDGGLIVNVGEPSAWLEIDCHTHVDADGVLHVGLLDPARPDAATLYYQRLDGAEAPPPGEHYRYQFRKRDGRSVAVEA